MADPRAPGPQVTDSQLTQPRTTAPKSAPGGNATLPAAPVPPDAIAWDARGLAPAIVQDARTGEVLMLAWQNREALARTLATGTATFFSRSRDSLWVKGATSGNTQAVRAVATDCDADAILLQVTPAGPACHTGARSCFFQPVAGAPLAAPPTLAASEPDAAASAPATQSVATAAESVAGATESVAGSGGPPAQPGAVLAALEAVLRSRRQSPPPGSYTAKLFADETLRHKKLGEEATELVIASLRGDREEIAGEAADLVFHALVLLQAHGMGLADIERVLHARENGPRRG